jgi:glycosyltransferase involved in cell wall biosynthesis
VIGELVESWRRHKTKLSIVPPTRGAFGTAVVLDQADDGHRRLERRLGGAGPPDPADRSGYPLEAFGPVLFTQCRTGLNGRQFTMLKFRTMVRDAEEQLDEIVRLDPEQVELAERYVPEQRFRLSMKPGLIRGGTPADTLRRVPLFGASGDLSVAFVNHYDFRSNSGVHIFNLANELVELGVHCTVLVPRDDRSVRLVGEPHFVSTSFRHAHDVRASLVHAWTPRVNVQKLTEQLCRRWRIPYVVHLEDNEDLVAAARAGPLRRRLLQLDAHKLEALVERSPLAYRAFLGGSIGVTAVIETLLEFKPRDLPGETISPAYETELFKPQPPDPRLRAELGLHASEQVVVYAGNTHSLNADEVRSLYLAIGLLNDQRTRVKLIRLGDDHVRLLRRGARHVRKHVIRVPYQPRSEVPRYLALADVLVQPGRAGRFNNYRFPSKLPEFFAMGKPIILPRSNLGRVLEDGKNCLLLETGEPLELAERIGQCLRDEELRARLGTAARAFAEESFSWPRSAARLLRFYERTLSVRASPGSTSRQVSAPVIR